MIGYGVMMFRSVPAGGTWSTTFWRTADPPALKSSTDFEISSSGTLIVLRAFVKPS